jgi:hypothetical protein
MPILGCPVLKIKVVTNPLFLLIILREWVIWGSNTVKNPYQFIRNPSVDLRF